MPDPIGQLRETADGKVWARSSTQVDGRLDGVIRRSIELDGRSSWVIGKYSGGLLSSSVLEGLRGKQGSEESKVHIYYR